MNYSERGERNSKRFRVFHFIEELGDGLHIAKYYVTEGKMKLQGNVSQKRKPKLKETRI
jgi:hypothetical protein